MNPITTHEQRHTRQEGHQSAVPDGLPELDGPGLMPRVSVIDSVRRHKVLAVLPAIVLVLAALAYGFLRTPTYTAQAYLSIGRIDVNQPGALSGFQQATATLATSYSRAIYATDVVETVARRTKLPPDEVRSRMTAYPVADSSIFVVAATGPSEDSAINLTMRGNRALRGYIEDLNDKNPNSSRLFRQYRLATLERSQRRSALDALTRQVSGGGVTAAERRRLAQARARYDSATLYRSVAARNYAASSGGQTMVSLVQEMVVPETATSDRFERLQILLFIALSVGVLLGLALATYRANRDLSRALAAR